MKIQVLTTFPEMFDSVMNSSIMKRAQDKNILEFKAHNLRDWTHDLHKTTDDDPYGGGSGLIMKCEPIFEAYDDIVSTQSSKPYVVIMAPQGKTLNDTISSQLTNIDNILFICGHYEGIDQRVYTLADQVLSIGDYVLSSGELSSMVVIDSVVRKLPGVLGADDGAQNESFADGLLEHPQYTRPQSYRGMDVPDVLLSGNHKLIDEWRRQESLRTTKICRPDLLENTHLSKDDKKFLESI